MDPLGIIHERALGAAAVVMWPPDTVPLPLDVNIWEAGVLAVTAEGVRLKQQGTVPPSPKLDATARQHKTDDGASCVTLLSNSSSH